VDPIVISHLLNVTVYLSQLVREILIGFAREAGSTLNGINAFVNGLKVRLRTVGSRAGNIAAG